MLRWVVEELFVLFIIFEYMQIDFRYLKISGRRKFYVFVDIKRGIEEWRKVVNKIWNGYFFFFLEEINQDFCKKLFIYNGKKKERKGYKKRVG